MKDCQFGVSPVNYSDSDSDRLILLYKSQKGKARIPIDDLIPKFRRCRNQHSIYMAFHILSDSTRAYKDSLFPKTIRDWNDLTDFLC